MGNRPTPSGAGQASGAVPGLGGSAEGSDTVQNIRRRAGNQPGGRGKAKRRPHMIARDQQRQERRSHRQQPNPPQALQGPRQIGALPGQQRPHRHGRHQRNRQRRRRRIEEGRPHRDFRAEQDIGKHRPKRAHQYHCRNGTEQQIIQHQPAFARDWREDPGAPQLGRAPGEQRQSPRHIGHQQRQDEHAARRIIGEGMHGIQNARTHQEGTEQRHAKGQNRQQDGPDFQAFALFHNNRGMQQRRANQPWQKRGIFHRVPEPIPAPAKFVISPPGPKRDAKREKGPGRERPGPHPTPPGCIHAPFQQRRHGKSKSHRITNITQVKHGRMQRQAKVLQQRIEPLPIHGRRPNALKRV